MLNVHFRYFYFEIIIINHVAIYLFRLSGPGIKLRSQKVSVKK